MKDQRLCRLFSARLREATERKKWTQTDLAAKVDLSQSSVSDMMHGAMPNAQTLWRLCQELGVSADWLLMGRGSREGGPASAGQSYQDGGLAVITEMRLALDMIEGVWRGTTSQAARDQLLDERAREERDRPPRRRRA